MNLFFQKTQYHHHYFIILLYVHIKNMIGGAVPWLEPDELHDYENIEQCLTQACVNSFAAMKLFLIPW